MKYWILPLNDLPLDTMELAACSPQGAAWGKLCLAKPRKQGTNWHGGGQLSRLRQAASTHNSLRLSPCPSSQSLAALVGLPMHPQNPGASKIAELFSLPVKPGWKWVWGPLSIFSGSRWASPIFQRQGEAEIPLKYLLKPTLTDVPRKRHTQCWILNLYTLTCKMQPLKNHKEWNHLHSRELQLKT